MPGTRPSTGSPLSFGSAVATTSSGDTIIVGDLDAGGSGSAPGPGAAFVFASTTSASASVAVEGSLAVLPQDIPFPSAAVGLTDVTVSYDSATGTAWKVRGDSSTWSVTVQVTGDFIDGVGGAIPVDTSSGGLFTIQIESADISTTGPGTDPASAVTSATAMSTTAATTILDATDDGGSPATGLSTGLFDVTPVFTLKVPGTTPDGNFTTTLVATAVAGP